MREESDCRVLVLAPTNKAADVLTRCVMECADITDGYEDWLTRFDATGDEDIEASDIFRDRTFDVCALDKSVTITTIALFPYDLLHVGRETTLPCGSSLGLHRRRRSIHDTARTDCLSAQQEDAEEVHHRCIIDGEKLKGRAYTILDKNGSKAPLTALVCEKCGRRYISASMLPRGYHAKDYRVCQKPVSELYDTTHSKRLTKQEPGWYHSSYGRGEVVRFDGVTITLKFPSRGPNAVYDFNLNYAVKRGTLHEVK